MPISVAQRSAQRTASMALAYLLKRAEEDPSAAGDAADAADALDDECAASFDDSRWGLRIGAIFIILVTSLLGTIIPIVLRNNRYIPRPFFDFAKFFGSGVIIATAFMHLLTPAFEELNSDCLGPHWHTYDWAPAIALMSVFAMMYAEAAAYRLGSARLEKLGVEYDSHTGDPADAHAHSHKNNPPSAVDTSGPEHPGHVHPHNLGGGGDFDMDIEAARTLQEKKEKDSFDDDSLAQPPSQAEIAAQYIAVIVLEFGVVLHSIIIGLTLATSDEFTILFIVIIFHQMFEGLGLGSRLAALHLPPRGGWTRYAGALLYSICTPVGMAAGLGVRKSFNGNGASFNAVSGILDAISAGILMYTGFVELIAHEVILNPRMMKASTAKLAYVFVCMGVGAGLMALLAKWA